MDAGRTHELITHTPILHYDIVVLKPSGRAGVECRAESSSGSVGIRHVSSCPPRSTPLASPPSRPSSVGLHTEASQLRGAHIVQRRSRPVGFRLAAGRPSRTRNEGRSTLNPPGAEAEAALFGTAVAEQGSAHTVKLLNRSALSPHAAPFTPHHGRGTLMAAAGWKTVGGGGAGAGHTCAARGHQHGGGRFAALGAIEDGDVCPPLVAAPVMDDLALAAARGLYLRPPTPDPERICPADHLTWTTGQRRFWPNGTARENVGRFGARRAVVQARFGRLAARLRVRARIAPELTRRNRAMGRWVEMMALIVLARANGALPSNADNTGPQDEYLELYCNGHASGWAAAQCACISVRQHLEAEGLAVPGFLRQAGPVAPQCAHDATNCEDAGAWAPACDDVGCTDDSIALEKVLAARRARMRTSPGGRVGAARDDIRAALRPTAQLDAPREHNWKWWRMKSHVRSRLRHGVRLPWTSPPPPFEKPGNANYVSADCEGTYTELTRLRRRGMLEGPFTRDEVERVGPVETKACIVVTPLAAVPKKNTTRVRLVVDFTAAGANARLPARTVTLPTCEDAVRNVKAPDMWAAKCDVADAFFINSLHVSERAHHVIWDPTPAGWTPPPGSEEAEFEGAGVHQYAAEGPESLRRYWRYTVTPFGSKLSPFYLSTLVDDLVSHLQQTWSMKILAYVDDMLVSGTSLRRVNTHVGLLRACMRYLGLGESVAKFEPGDLTWSWLGLEIDTRAEALEVRYPDDKKARLVAEMATFEGEFRGAGRRAPRKDLASLVGKMSFAANGVHHGKLYLRHLYDGLHRDNAGLSLHERVHCLGTTTLHDEFWEAWDWWKRVLPIARGRRFWVDRSTAFHRIFGDASKRGRGATWYTHPQPRAFAAAFDDSMMAASSNLRELSTLWSAIVCWGHLWKPGDRVLYTTDNMTTAACINRACPASPQLMAETRRIHEWGATHGIEFLARWVSGDAIIIEGSDGLSREDRFEPPVRTEWRLIPGVAQHWERVYGCPPCMPVFDDVGDALRTAIKAHAADPNATAAFVVPQWPTASWWPLMKQFRLDFSYEAGTRLLQHPADAANACTSRHPLAVIRLPAVGEPALTATQRRHGRACVSRRATPAS